MADKSSIEDKAKTRDASKTEDASKTQDPPKTQDPTKTDDGRDKAEKTGGEDKSPLDERVEQIDKNETYEDVIGRHEPGDRYPNQRR